jgi:hypothetical protein
MTSVDPIAALHADAMRFESTHQGKVRRGIEAVALALGRPAGVLYNKFSEADERYQITDREADAIADLVRQQSGSQGYIEAKCERHGGLFVPALEGGAASDDDVMQGVLDTLQMAGDLARELTEARRDGLITPDEFAVLRSRVHRLIAAEYRLLRDVESQVVPDAAQRGFAGLRVAS